jgi:hypothetical protein
MKIHIPVIFEIECADIDEARRATQRAIETMSFKDFKGGDEAKATPITMRIADDGMKAKTGQRVYLLHPSDAAGGADYSPEEYEAKFEKQNNNEEN